MKKTKTHLFKQDCFQGWKGWCSNRIFQRHQTTALQVEYTDCLSCLESLVSAQEESQQLIEFQISAALARIRDVKEESKA